MVIKEILERNSKVYPGRTCLIEGDVSLTYGQLDEKVNRTANAFLKVGMGKKEKVGILMLNCKEYVEILFALSKICAVAVPLNFLLTGRELVQILTFCKVRTLIFNIEFYHLIKTIRSELDFIDRFIHIGSITADTIDIRKVSAGCPAAPPDTRCDKNELALLMFTSGSTGIPKGVMLSAENILTNVNSLAFHFAPFFGSRALPVGQFFHISPIIALFVSYVMGACVIVLKEPNNSFKILELIEKEKVTYLDIPSAMINPLLQAMGSRQYDLDSLQCICYGTSAIQTEAIKKALGILKCHFFQGYGLTESTAVLTLLYPEDHIIDDDKGKSIRLKSIGKEIYGCEVRVISDGRDVQPGEIGEIIARGDNVMMGYYDDPAATSEYLRDGWLYTGDMATVDEDGFIYIVDRKKNIIISGGENISSQQVEDVLLSHPGIAEAAVIGVPDRKKGEKVKAFIVLKPGINLSKKEIVDYCAHLMAHYKIPKEVEFMENLPKTPLGKIKKRDLTGYPE